MKGFIISANDSNVKIFYDIFLIIAQLILVYFPNRKINSIERQDSSTKLSNILLIIGACCSVFLTLCFPIDNSILFKFGWRELGDSFAIVTSTNRFYSTLEKLSYIGLTCSIIQIFKNKKIFYKLMYICLMYSNICIESKRSIIFLAMLFILYIWLDMKEHNIKKILFIGLCICSLTVFIGIGTKLDRGYQVNEALYGTLRVDYFRDDRVKMVIYSLIDTNMKILKYPGQSYLLQIGYIFPLDFIKMEKLGYNTLFTGALTGNGISSSENFMTTSICDESIANFGWIGFIIAPLMLAILSNFTEKQTKIIKQFGVVAIILLYMYPLCYIMWYLEMFIILILADRIIINKRTRR